MDFSWEDAPEDQTGEKLKLKSKSTLVMDLMVARATIEKLEKQVLKLRTDYQTLIDSKHFSSLILMSDGMYGIWNGPPLHCCSGADCSCQGMPVEPPDDVGFVVPWEEREVLSALLKGKSFSDVYPMARLLQVLLWLTKNGPEGISGLKKDKYDYAAEVANERGHKEPTEADELEGFLRMILVAQTEVK